MRLAALRYLVLALLLACGDRKASPPLPASSASTPPASLPAVAHPERGAAWLAKYECARCHTGERLEPPPAAKRCVGCHADILAGRFDAPPSMLTEWRPRVARLPAAPSLDVAGFMLRRDWLASYLLKPHDLRPHLDATMPRFGLTPQDAVDLAAQLAPTRAPTEAPSRDLVPEGRRLFAAKGCGSCHAFTGTGDGTPSEPPSGAVLAPDLRHTRDRVVAGRLSSFIRSPRSVVPSATMPRIEMTDDESEALAAFILFASLAPVPPPSAPPRLPVLSRRVGWPEVRDRVFRKVCWHCHAQPDFARGDGGPGMSGGFGYPGRKLDLSTYEAIQSGYLDDDGELVSLFTPSEDGTPRLLQALLNRQLEVQGELPAMRGMPLGFPPLPPEDIQLVETWIAQGRPR